MARDFGVLGEGEGLLIVAVEAGSSVGQTLLQAVIEEYTL